MRQDPLQLDVQLSLLLRAALDLPANTPLDRMSRQNLPEWDSLRHVKIMLELQKVFGIRLSAVDFLRLNSFQEIKGALLARS